MLVSCKCVAPKSMRRESATRLKWQNDTNADQNSYIAFDKIQWRMRTIFWFSFISSNFSTRNRTNSFRHISSSLGLPHMHTKGAATPQIEHTNIGNNSRIRYASRCQDIACRIIWNIHRINFMLMLTKLRCPRHHRVTAASNRRIRNHSRWD